ncbi:hypothetical protein CALCODRAFT_488945, partial [Calocera cornea HHB12733]
MASVPNSQEKRQRWETVQKAAATTPHAEWRVMARKNGVAWGKMLVELVRDMDYHPTKLHLRLEKVIPQSFRMETATLLVRRSEVHAGSVESEEADVSSDKPPVRKRNIICQGGSRTKASKSEIIEIDSDTTEIIELSSEDSDTEMKTGPPTRKNVVAVLDRTLAAARKGKQAMELLHEHVVYSGMPNRSDKAEPEYGEMPHKELKGLWASFEEVEAGLNTLEWTEKTKEYGPVIRDVFVALHRFEDVPPEGIPPCLGAILTLADSIRAGVVAGQRRQAEQSAAARAAAEKKIAAEEKSQVLSAKLQSLRRRMGRLSPVTSPTPARVLGPAPSGKV